MCNKLIAVLILLLFSIAVSCQEAEEEPAITYDKSGAPILSCKAACLMDADTGQVLYKKNQYAHLPNASTTKLMTCILALERLPLDDMLTASDNVASTPFTSLYMTKGEKISVKDALAGAVVKSANDTCVLFAEAVSGNTKRFAALMNKKALELGMMDTHFVNPHGLYDKNHYSSAYDMCLLGKEALKYPIITEMAMKRKYVLDSRTENRQNVLIYNKTKFTRDYKYATG
ncbi:MAG: D-alanyl-D-alanine carboxypeptidase, partial [Abditibacteriota bacterium]|nr:D-alanyl-D-alanine carboxypeptidase [Abditibacteriota bacterium]